MSIRVGVIGVGGMGACHARHVVDLAGAELAWVADPDEAVGRSLANELGCEWLAEGMDRIDEADALVIACPDRFHHRYVMAGLERGVPVLAEKPLTVELADALESLLRTESLELEAERRLGLSAPRAGQVVDLRPESFARLDRETLQ